MKVSCRVRGDWFHVPCKNAKLSVRWLGEEALRRYLRTQSDEERALFPNGHEVYEIRKTQGGALCDPDDTVKAVLDDNDYVSVVLACDRAHPTLGPAEIPYVPEQVGSA